MARMVKLDETEDALYDEIRHMHIADAARALPAKVRDGFYFFRVCLTAEGAPPHHKTKERTNCRKNEYG